MDAAEECCGFGGTFSVKFAEVSGGMARTKIDSIVRTGAIDRRLHRFQLPDADSGRAFARRPADPHPASGRSAGQPLIHVRRLRRENPRDARRSQAAARHLHRHRPPDRKAPQSRRRRRSARITRSCAPHANAVKKHTIEHLDYYLEQFERNVAAHGGKVVFCKDADGGRRFRAGPGQGAPRQPDREIEIDDHRGNRSQRAPGASPSGSGRDRSGRVHHPARARAAVSHRGAGAAHDARPGGRSAHREAGRAATKPSSRSRP